MIYDFPEQAVKEYNTVIGLVTGVVPGVTDRNEDYNRVFHDKSNVHMSMTWHGNPKAGQVRICVSGGVSQWNGTAHPRKNVSIKRAYTEFVHRVEETMKWNRDVLGKEDQVRDGTDKVRQLLEAQGFTKSDDYRLSTGNYNIFDVTALRCKVTVMLPEAEFTLVINHVDDPFVEKTTRVERYNNANAAYRIAVLRIELDNTCQETVSEA